MTTMIFDSQIASLDEALYGIHIPEDIRKTLALVGVNYISFDGRLHQGQIVVHQELVSEVRFLFTQLFSMKFPIAQVVPVCVYDWNDDQSMRANNSSGFNFRMITGTDRYSEHSYGWALDLNPMLNPCMTSDGRINPPGAFHDAHMPGTLTRESSAVKLFTSNGWTWGGNWQTLRDYQHFQKPLNRTALT